MNNYYYDPNQYNYNQRQQDFISAPQQLTFSNGNTLRLQFQRSFQGKEAVILKMIVDGCEKVFLICSDGSTITAWCVPGTSTTNPGPPFCNISCTTCTPPPPPPPGIVDREG